MWQLVSMRNNLYSIYANNRRIYLLLYFYTMNRLFSISLHSFFKNFSNSQTDKCFKLPWYVHPHIHTGTCSRWCGTTGQCPCKLPVGDLTVSGGWWCGGPGRSPGWWGDKAEIYRLRFCPSVHVLHPANGFLCIHSGMEIRCFRKKPLSVIFTTTHQSGNTCRSICNVFV